MMPTLTQIRDYHVDHLVEPVPGLTAAADNWPYHSAGALRDLTALEWAGVNGSATIAALTATHAKATVAAEPVAAVAALAGPAASAGLAHQSRVMTIVGWCLEGAYWVNDDLTLTDMFRSPSTAVYKMRSQIMDWLADLLHDAAGQLAAHDQSVAEAIDGHSTALTHIQMVDNTCLTPDQVKRKLWHDAIKGAIPGGIAGGVALGPVGILTGGAAGAIGNDTGDLIDIINGATRVCE